MYVPAIKNDNFARGLRNEAITFRLIENYISARTRFVLLSGMTITMLITTQNQIIWEECC